METGSTLGPELNQSTQNSYDRISATLDDTGAM